MAKKIIGISGVAGVGKDQFANILIQKLNSAGFKGQRFAFADKLKDEVAAFCSFRYGIDARNCSRKEKELIRPILIAHGLIKRKMTANRYWADHVFDQIAQTDATHAIITDLRHDDGLFDEFNQIKSYKGIVVHISMENVLPASKEEEYFDPIIKSKADHCIKWEKFNENVEQKIGEYVDEFIEKFKLC